MKTTIRVVQSRQPKRGRFITEGRYEYFHTAEGLPAMQFRWQGLVLPGPKATFVFPRDVVQIGLLADDESKSAARSSAAYRGSLAGGAGGVLTSLLLAGIGAAAARTSNIKGFGVLYRNPDDHAAAFLAVASPDIVDEIFRAVPEDKHEKSAQQPEPFRPT